VAEAADDLGAKRNLLISPAVHRRFIKPRAQKLCARIRDLAPNAFRIHHTDGSVFSILPDLIAVGVNTIDPVQTSAKKLDAARLKAACGDRPAFHGAVEKIEKSRDALVRCGQGTHRRAGPRRRLPPDRLQPHDRRAGRKHRGEVRDGRE